MRPLASESLSHSPDALEYKNNKRAELLHDLDSAIMVYGNTLPATAKENIKKAVERTIDPKITQLEQTYRDMRTKRGEKITIQDMDDIMPYVHLAMLKELQIQLGDRNDENSKRLADTIHGLEQEIQATSQKINILRSELEGASNKSIGALRSLTKSDEYKKLWWAYQALGKNSGALEAWKEVQKMASNWDITKDLDTYLTQAESEIWAQEGAINIIKGILSKDVHQIERKDVNAYIKQLQEKIKPLLDSNAISWDLKHLWEDLITILDDPGKTIQQIQSNLELFQINSQSLFDWLNTWWTTFKETIREIKQESDKIKQESQKWKDKIDAIINTKIHDLDTQTGNLKVSLEKAKKAFQKKIDAIKPLIEESQKKAEELGQSEGKNTILDRQKNAWEESKKKFEAAASEAVEKAHSIDQVKTTLDAKQKIRINASNLILRSEPKKSAKPLLTEDKKKAIMLQPGDLVTPILDNDGNISTIQDGPRDYTHVRLSNGTEWWIALSDKIRGGYKQEYGDINFEEGTLDTTTSYRLKWDNIRLRTGFSQKADTLNVLENKNITNIQRIKKASIWDNAPEWSNLLWAQVLVTYKDGKTQNGYIAEKFLEEKTGE